jgi:hypothetical protein
MNGIPAKAHLGRTIYEVLGEFAAKVEPLFQHVLATGNPVLNVHVTGNLPMRSEPGHWVENYFPLKDSAGEVQRLCSMVVEVTEQKKLEESFHLLSSACKDGTDQLKVLVEFHSQLLQSLSPPICGCDHRFRQSPNSTRLRCLDPKGRDSAPTRKRLHPIVDAGCGSLASHGDSRD